MKTTLKMLNRMVADGVVGQYAIGGAVGATFYLEPAATLDVDIFVVLPQTQGSALLSLSPIYEYLTSRNCIAHEEHIIVGDWPVQFLPVSSPLEAEALEQAVDTDLDGTPTRVLGAEHLVAIALSTGRAKDYARIIQFLDQKAVNRQLLDAILERHGLMVKWKKFQQRYLEEL